MKLILVGYMGSGKSTVGKRLAKRLDMRFLDLDDYIQEKTKSTIADIFATKGEIYFRTLETQCIQEVLALDENFVLALGGGTPCYGTNMELMNAAARTIYLSGSLNYIYERLAVPKRKAKRPLIAHIGHADLKEFIAKHLFERRPYYEKAHYQISIDHKKKAQVVAEILAAVSIP